MNTKVPIDIPVWLIAIIPVAIVISVFIIFLIMDNNKNSEEIADKDKKSKNLINLIEKKDILYWLLITCLGSISLFTYGYRNSDEAISHWGFAGTIVSIILAVIAIGFTLFQTFSQTLSSEKIAESAENIIKASEALDTTHLVEASDVIVKASKDISNFNHKLEVRLEKLNDEMAALKDAHLDSSNRFSELISGYESTSLSNEENVSNEDIIDISIFLDKIYPHLAAKPKFFAFSYFYLYEVRPLNNKINRHKFLKSHTQFLLGNSEKYEENDFKFRYQYYFGASMGSFGATINFLSKSGIIKNFKHMDTSSREELLKKAEELIKPDELEFLNNFIEKNE